jgi:hypothetical protein
MTITGLLITAIVSSLVAYIVYIVRYNKAVNRDKERQDRLVSQKIGVYGDSRTSYSEVSDGNKTLCITGYWDTSSEHERWRTSMLTFDRNGRQIFNRAGYIFATFFVCNAAGVGFYLDLNLKRAGPTKTLQSAPLGQACPSATADKDCGWRTNYEANRDGEANPGEAHRDAWPNGWARSLGPLVDGLRTRVDR